MHTVRLIVASLLAAGGISSCANSDAPPSLETHPSKADLVRRYEDLPQVEEGGLFQGIDQWAAVLDERGIHCEIQYRLGRGGRCLIEGKPANLFFGDPPTPVDELVKAGIDAYAIGWNWRLDTGFNTIAERVHEALPGTRFITY